MALLCVVTSAMAATHNNNAESAASVEASFLRSSLKKTAQDDETPAKRVKMSHELVTPASSQTSSSDEQTSKDTAEPTLSPTSHSPYSLVTPMSQGDIRKLLLKEAKYNVEDTEHKTPKRQEYLSWDDFFMSVALLSAKRSKDPSTPTGACIVDDEYRVIGIGYNGFPRGCSDDALPWISTGEAWLHSPNPFMVHAEVNAILNKCSDTVAGARMYVPNFPCKFTLARFLVSIPHYSHSLSSTTRQRMCQGDCSISH